MRMLGTETSPWLSCPRPKPRAGIRLFCFPYSGASAQVFYPWADLLPEAIEVCPVQLPGHGNRLAELPILDIHLLVLELAEGLRSHFDAPFAFFGHSMGALVSFELAHYLRREHDLSPVHLFVSGHGAPQLDDREPPIHRLPDAEFVAKIRNLNGMPQEILNHAELMALLLPILRADFTACETYRFQPGNLLDCPLWALGGLQDVYATRERLEPWGELTTGPFSVRMFPGDHFYLNTAQPLLLRTLARALS